VGNGNGVELCDYTRLSPSAAGTITGWLGSQSARGGLAHFGRVMLWLTGKRERMVPVNRTRQTISVLEEGFTTEGGLKKDLRRASTTLS